jgi:hypothetical protein
MQASQIPARFTIPWAKNAAGAYIRTVPVASQIGIQDGAASFNDGFVPDNFTPVAAGGVPPFGQDFNGALNVITTWDQWYQAGGAIGFDATFAAAIGGYPAGAVLNSNVLPGAQWYSFVDGNLTNPDDPLTSTGWARVGLPSGTMLPLFTSSPVPGFITANGGGVGNSASGATNASDVYLFLFKAIWDQWSPTQCPIFTNTGAPSTRGANAVADFQAGKRLQTPSMRGTGLIGCDTMGGAASTFLAGVPVVVGNTTSPASTIGENVHTLTVAELASHLHTAGISDPTHLHQTNFGVRGFSTSGSAQAFQTAPGIDGTVGYNSLAAATNVRVNSSNGLDTTNSTGGGGAHNTVERNNTCFWGLKT